MRSHPPWPAPARQMKNWPPFGPVSTFSPCGGSSPGLRYTRSPGLYAVSSSSDLRMISSRARVSSIAHHSSGWEAAHAASLVAQTGPMPASMLSGVVSSRPHTQQLPLSIA